MRKIRSHYPIDPIIGDPIKRRPLYYVSGNLYDVSCILNYMSCILYPVSNMLNPKYIFIIIKWNPSWSVWSF
jgi:hypothetical protein